MAAHDELLVDYVARAIEIQEQGAEVSYPDLCRDHPELADAVREALGRRKVVARWVRDGVTDSLVGRILEGRYCVCDCIGAGAMGAVYRATDLELQRDVAIKVMQPRPFGASDSEKRFLREGHALATLRHRNVVPVYDRGITEDGLHFLIMELLEGIPMSRLLAEVEERSERPGGGGDDCQWIDDLLAGPRHRERSYTRRCVEWAAQLASGLASAHAAGFVHRDVKPSNAFLTGDGQALLIDFGVAAREVDPTLTGAATALGTPQYMAPEQVDGNTPPNPQFDVYSLSATLYHMLAGRAPYRGTPAAVLTAIQRGGPEPIGRLHNGLPRDLQVIVECGMERDPTQRYGTAAALEADLRAFLEQRPIRARRTPAVIRAVRAAMRSPLVRIAGVVVFAALLAVAEFAWAQDRQRQLRADHLQIYAYLPPTLTLGRSGVIADETNRQKQFENLDRAVLLHPTHLATRCLRAALRFDHGDLDGAARDHAAIADQLGTRYARVLAERYQKAATTGSPAALDLAGLPPPGPGGAFVAGFQALRARDWSGAVELLPEDSADLSVREYRLYALLAFAASTGDLALITRLGRDALELAGAFGLPTSRTLYVRERSLLQDKRYREALEPLEDLIERAPDDYNVAVHLAIAYRRTDQFALAEATARRAAQLRPPRLNEKALSTLAKALAQQGRFDDALASVDEMPADEDDGEARAWRRHETRAFVEFERCLHHVEDPDAARAAAASAMQLYAAAGALRGAPTSMRTNVEAFKALVENDNDGFCQSLLALLEDETGTWRQLRNLGHRLPDECSPGLVERLRAYFLAASAAARERK